MQIFLRQYISNLLQIYKITATRANIFASVGPILIIFIAIYHKTVLLVWYTSCLYTKNVPLGTLFLWEAGGICRCKDRHLCSGASMMVRSVLGLGIIPKGLGDSSFTP